MLPVPCGPFLQSFSVPLLLITPVPCHTSSLYSYDAAASAFREAPCSYACNSDPTISLIRSPIVGDTAISTRTPSLLVRLTKGGVSGRIFDRTIEGLWGIRPVARHALAILVDDIASFRAP